MVLLLLLIIIIKYVVIHFLQGDKPKIKDKLGMTLDLDKGTLHFDINGEKKTTHFNIVPIDKRLYPTISSVYGNSEMAMVYYGKPPPNFP